MNECLINECLINECTHPKERQYTSLNDAFREIFCTNCRTIIDKGLFIGGHIIQDVHRQEYRNLIDWATNKLYRK